MEASARGVNSGMFSASASALSMASLRSLILSFRLFIFCVLCCPVGLCVCDYAGPFKERYLMFSLTASVRLTTAESILALVVAYASFSHLFRVLRQFSTFALILRGSATQ